MATFNAPGSVPISGLSHTDGQQFSGSFSGPFSGPFSGGAPLPLILINLQEEFSFLIEQVNPLSVYAGADNII